MADKDCEIFTVTKDQLDYYNYYFNSLSNDGEKIKGKDLVEFFRKSNLSSKILAFIWKWSDFDEDGHLCKSEFFVFFHITVLLIHGYSVDKKIVQNLHISVIDQLEKKNKPKSPKKSFVSGTSLESSKNKKSENQFKSFSHTFNISKNSNIKTFLSRSFSFKEKKLVDDSVASPFLPNEDSDKEKNILPNSETIPSNFCGKNLSNLTNINQNIPVCSFPTMAERMKKCAVTFLDSEAGSLAQEKLYKATNEEVRQELGKYFRHQNSA